MGQYIGYGGTGVFNQEGSTNSAQRLEMGVDRGSAGTYNLNVGTLAADTFLQIGISGTGTLTQKAGTSATVGEDLYLGYNPPLLDNPAGSGTYNLQGGSLSATNEFIGYRGTGSFTQTGGTNTATTSIIIANDPGSSGAYNFLGGSLSANTIQVNSGGTFMGQGTLSALFTNNGLVRPGASPGTLNIVGSYTQGPAGTLEVEIASATNYDRLNVSGSPGTASLNSTLKPLLLGG